MRVCDYSFRELDRKWVGITDNKMCKKIAKKIKQKKLICPIFGFFYIDMDNGLSLRVVGNIEKDGHHKLYLDEKLIFNDALIVDYDFVEKSEVTILDDEVVDNLDGASVLENKLLSNYKNVNNFLSTREMQELDAFRNPQFPDDVQVLLRNHNDDPDELLWARIEGIMDVKPDVLICRLLTNSYYNKEYVEDTMIGVKYFADDDALKVVGLLKKRNQK